MDRWNVTTKTTLAPFAILDGGYAIPEAFSIEATDEATRVEVEVEVVAGKARTASVRVSTDATGGVSARMLRAVPIRDLVGTAVQGLLAKVVADGKTVQISPVPTWSEDEVLATKRLVGYVDPPEAKR